MKGRQVPWTCISAEAAGAAQVGEMLELIPNKYPLL